MSDTPRTDAEALLAGHMTATDYVVPADFARQLEREVMALRSQPWAILNQACKDCGKVPPCECDRSPCGMVRFIR